MSFLTHPKLSEAVKRHLAAEPESSIHLILRVTEAGDAHQAQIQAAGFQVHYRLTLLPCFAVSGPGQGLVPLMDQPWLLAVELDQDVSIT